MFVSLSTTLLVSLHMPHGAIPGRHALWASQRPLSSAARHAPSCMQGLPLTGSTLRAALKWQCDATGAGYAVYWAKVGSTLVVAGDYTTDSRREVLRQRGLKGSFAIESEGFAIEIGSDDPVATCFRARQHAYLKDASGAEISRASLVRKYRIAQIAYIPFEDGVMEFGTSLGSVSVPRSNQTRVPSPRAPAPCPVAALSDISGDSDLGK
jgi:hypothetical protein